MQRKERREKRVEECRRLGRGQAVEAELPDKICKEEEEEEDHQIKIEVVEEDFMT